MERCLVDIEGGTAECLSEGDGVSIVLLPGSGLTVGYLGEVADALVQDGMRAVRINRRGSGQSTGPPEGITLVQPHEFSARRPPFRTEQCLHRRVRSVRRSEHPRCARGLNGCPHQRTSDSSSTRVR